MAESGRCQYNNKNYKRKFVENFEILLCLHKTYAEVVKTKGRL